ncbi:15576_t:CDS:2 [Gigaspora margarita]|uniref:15576_t:CDS:1 n=1 Tax=Gigaspora margarita TaxID=4874 RepID=A0ABN7UDF4_GIGMA|nr:15576_t:CDS:2 [Gigaspora margarita]
MKKALNTALDLGCKKELINIVACFIEQKKAELENITNKNKNLINLNSDYNRFSGPIYNYNTIDPQDPNLRISLLNANSNNDNNNAKDHKRKYVYNIYSETGHNACIYK